MTGQTWPAPVVGADTRPFWDYARTHELRAQRCTACGALRLPPGPVCPACFAPGHEWVALSGRGVVQSWVEYHRQYHPAFPVPYTVVLVELAEGPRIEGLLHGPGTVTWRAPVRLVWQERDGFAVPAFELIPVEARS